VVERRRGERVADDAGNADFDLAGGGGGDAAERDGALAELAPGREVALVAGPLRLRSSIEASAALRIWASSIVSAASTTSLRIGWMSEGWRSTTRLSVARRSASRAALLARVYFAMLPTVRRSVSSRSFVHVSMHRMRETGP
jgi:hypothetical protein